jgi:hypothetical protein
MKPVLLTAALCLAALTGMSACSGNIKTVSATSSAVIVQYPPSRRNAAEQRAAALCADYGKQAQLRSRHDQYTIIEQTAIYDCIGGS